MKKRLANILLKFILLHSDNKLKAKFFLAISKEYTKLKYKNFRAIYSIANSFKFNGQNIIFTGEGEIVCGKNSYIGSYSTIQAASGFKVVIGDNCSLSHNIRVYTTSSATDQDFNTNLPKKISSGNVIVGNGVWIGANVFIKEGITIGDNAIIGANSMVVKNIEANAIYGGVPAKLIRNKRI